VFVYFLHRGRLENGFLPHILYVPLILQQIQISVDQPYAGPGCQLLHYQRDI
jgi:hypothetical protein